MRIARAPEALRGPWRGRHRRAVAGAGWLCVPWVFQAAHACAPFVDADANAAIGSAAQLAQGGLLMEGLHRRLGEIRQVMPVRDVGGEVFMRNVHGMFEHVGGFHAARSRAAALQLGGNVAYWNDGGAHQRAGWALDRGTLRVRPGRTTGIDNDIRGLAAWYTRHGEGGAYVDAGIRRASGTGRARGVAKVRTGQWTLSTEAGAPLPLGDNLIVEPQVQLTYQSLRTRVARGIGTIRTRQATARLGVRIARIDNERFVPYLQAELERQFAGRSRAAPAGASSVDAAAVRNGSALRLSTGLTIKVHRTVDVYAHAGVQRRLAGGGSTGGSFGAGLRINF